MEIAPFDPDMGSADIRQDALAELNHADAEAASARTPQDTERSQEIEHGRRPGAPGRAVAPPGGTRVGFRPMTPPPIACLRRDRLHRHAHRGGARACRGVPTILAGRDALKLDAAAATARSGR